MKRRNLLKSMLVGAAGANTLVSGSPLAIGIRKANAAECFGTNGGKTVVHIFQAGACDSVNTVIPTDYIEDTTDTNRPSAVHSAVRHKDDTNPNTDSLRPDLQAKWSETLSLSGVKDIRLHENMTGFQNIFDNGDMAIMPAVNHKQSTTSHFENRYLVESGVEDINGSFYDQLEGGWLNRYLTETESSCTDRMRGICLDSVVSQALRGVETDSVLVSATAGQHNFDINANGTYGNSLQTAIENAYANLDTTTHPYNELLKENADKLFDDIDTLDKQSGNIDLETALVTNLTAYNTLLGISNRSGNWNWSTLDSKDYGGYSNQAKTFFKKLRQVAILIEENTNSKTIGLEAAAITFGGWDHHGNQNDQLPEMIEAYCDGIYAFYLDLQDAGLLKDTIIISGTEFGRTVEQNSALGTDHGTGGAWYVIGNSDTTGLSSGDVYLNGGVYYGTTYDSGDNEVALTYPTLSDKGTSSPTKFLHPTLDVRDIYEAVLLDFYERPNVTSTLPDWSRPADYSELPTEARAPKNVKALNLFSTV